MVIRSEHGGDDLSITAWRLNPKDLLGHFGTQELICEPKCTRSLVKMLFKRTAKVARIGKSHCVSYFLKGWGRATDHIGCLIKTGTHKQSLWTQTCTIFNSSEQLSSAEKHLFSHRLDIKSTVTQMRLDELFQVINKITAIFLVLFYGQALLIGWNGFVRFANDTNFCFKTSSQ